VSGLAHGIDSAAHRGAVSGKGKTVAVLGSGADIVHPQSNRELARKILETGGALVSEFPIGTPAKPQHFPQRNRIISGLCSGLLVIEATKRSGSLITAKMALEQNREVFAIPGAINNPLAQGCNALIQEGAKLTTHCQDILEEFNIRPDFTPNTSPQPALDTLSISQKNILETVQFNPTVIDTIVDHTKHPTHLILSTLLQLEILGFISSENGFYTRLK
jgi:DNA processing protein